MASIAADLYRAPAAWTMHPVASPAIRGADAGTLGDQLAMFARQKLLNDSLAFRDRASAVGRDAMAGPAEFGNGWRRRYSLDFGIASGLRMLFALAVADVARQPGLGMRVRQEIFRVDCVTTGADLMHRLAAGRRDLRRENGDHRQEPDHHTGGFLIRCESMLAMLGLPASAIDNLNSACSNSTTRWTPTCPNAASPQT